MQQTAHLAVLIKCVVVVLVRHVLLLVQVQVECVKNLHQLDVVVRLITLKIAHLAVLAVLAVMVVVMSLLIVHVHSLNLVVPTVGKAELVSLMEHGALVQAMSRQSHLALTAGIIVLGVIALVVGVNAKEIKIQSLHVLQDRLQLPKLLGITLQVFVTGVSLFVNHVLPLSVRDVMLRVSLCHMAEDRQSAEVTQGAQDVMRDNVRHTLNGLVTRRILVVAVIEYSYIHSQQGAPQGQPLLLLKVVVMIMNCTS